MWLIDNVLFMSKNYDSLVMSLRKIVTLTTFGIYSVLLNVDSDNVNYNFCRFWSMLILIYKFLQPPFVNNMVRWSHGRMSTSLSYEKKKHPKHVISWQPHNDNCIFNMISLVNMYLPIYNVFSIYFKVYSLTLVIIVVIISRRWIMKANSPLHFIFLIETF